MKLNRADLPRVCHHTRGLCKYAYSRNGLAGHSTALPPVSYAACRVLFGLTSRGSLERWKWTAVMVAVRPTPALFWFAKPISELLGEPRTDSTTLVASSLLSARTRTTARSLTSNSYSIMTSPSRGRLFGPTKDVRRFRKVLFRTTRST